MERPHPRSLTAPNQGGKAHQIRPYQSSVWTKVTEPRHMEGRKRPPVSIGKQFIHYMAFLYCHPNNKASHKVPQTLRPRRFPRRPTTGLLHRALVGFVHANKKIKAAVKIGALAHAWLRSQGSGAFALEFAASVPIKSCFLA